VRINGDKISSLQRSKGEVAIITTLLISVAALSLCGCNGVRRRLTIRTDPPGAVVYLNDKELGRTPISQNIIYSGAYKIRCYKEGYEAEERLYKVGTPWYLYPGIDFFSENFTPGELRDEQTCVIEMTPKRTVPEDELYENATKLREEAHNNTQIKYGSNASN